MTNKNNIDIKIKKSSIKLSKYKEKFLLFVKKNSVIPYIAVGIPLFFLSMMLAAQMKSMSDSKAVIEGKRESQLADDLLTLQRKYNDLKIKYDENDKIVEEYQNNSATNDRLTASMKSQIEHLGILSGTTNLKGQGIIVTLTDGSSAVDPELRTDTLVHDSDVLTLVNELKAAGAEAISVNGQRIISTTAIRCVGPVIQVNYQKVAAPFEIKAIGNAQYLESALTLKNGVADLLSQLGVGVNITRQNEIFISKFEGTISMKNAVMAK
ncbi:MAG: DUF881 domain-containing protein [Clostridia bacterium]